MGTDLTSINTSDFTYGVVPTARIGTNAGSSTTFLRGDNSWQTIVTTPVGTDTQIQYNAGGVLASSSNFTFAYAINTLYVTNLAGNASAVQSLNASNLVSGIIAPSYLGSGTANTTTFLRGDSTWQAPPVTPAAGGNLAVQFNNNGVFGGTSGFLFNSASTPPTVQITGMLDTHPVANTASLRYRDTGTSIRGGFTYYGTPFGSLAVPCVCGRLTLNSAHPAPVTDQAATSIIYYLPCNGAYITLYNNILADFENIRVPDAGYSLNISALPVGYMYDLFILNNLNGTAQLVYGAAWTNSGPPSPVRADSLYSTAGMSFLGSNQNARYVGSFYTTPVAGQTMDTKSVRCLWNAYNQVPRKLLLSNVNPAGSSGGSWTCINPTTGTTITRAVNGDNNQRAYFIIGGDPNHVGMTGAQFVLMDSTKMAYIPTQGCSVMDGVALDQSPVSGFVNDMASQISAVGGIAQLSTLQNRFIPTYNLSIGFHWFTMSESFYNGSGASATVTFYTGSTQMIGWLMG